MKICLLTVGKTTTEYLRKGIEEYASRAVRMIPFEVRSIPDVKTHANSPPSSRKPLRVR